MGLTPRVEAWRVQGEDVEFGGRRIHLYRRGGNGPLLLLLHGFPSSSYDWRFVVEHDASRPVLAPDFLGFGLSEKPRWHTYSLHWQADMVCELVDRYGGGQPVFVVGHDMGTSVATELLARDIRGELPFEVLAAVLFNGSILAHLAHLTPAQKILLSPAGPLLARLTSKAFFRQQLGSTFSAEHPLSREEADDQWSLLTHGGGRTLGHKLIHYYRERLAETERWHGAFRDWPGRLSLVWALKDPVAGPWMLEGLRELRPEVPVAELPELGHYPQIEGPERFGKALFQAYSAAL